MTTVYDKFDDDDDFDALLDTARMQASTDWEESFIVDLTDRFKRFGFAMTITDRQIEMIRRIAGDDK